MRDKTRNIAREMLNAIDRYEYRISRSILYREDLYYDENIMRCRDEIREVFRKAIIDPNI